MSRWQRVLVARVLIVSCAFLWGCFFSASVNLTGTWVGTMQWSSGPASGVSYPIVLDLVHENRELSGAVTLRSHGDSTFDLPVVQGSAHNMSLSLVARGNNPWVPGTPTVEFRIDGTFDQTGMSGDGTQSVDGNVYTFTWTAVLTTEPQPAGLRH